MCEIINRIRKSYTPCLVSWNSFYDLKIFSLLEGRLSKKSVFPQLDTLSISWMPGISLLSNDEGISDLPYPLTIGYSFHLLDARSSILNNAEGISVLPPDQRTPTFEL
jgi:hypothetical protein